MTPAAARLQKQNELRVRIASMLRAEADHYYGLHMDALMSGAEREAEAHRRLADRADRASDEVRRFRPGPRRRAAQR